MNTFMIGYDLNKPRGQNDYDNLHDAIKKISGYYWHYLDSTWLVKSSKDAGGIRDYLKPYLDSGDELLVVVLGANWASTGFDKEATDWLYANMPKTANAYQYRM